MADTPIHLGIYDLQRQDERDYGEYTRMVVVEESEAKARVRAGRSAGDSMSILWADTTVTEATLLGHTVEGATARIVMSERLGD